MSETQFGERYFATRERLSTVMEGIATLAEETGADLADRLPVEEIRKGLGNPFLFVVCGEVNAGKSTLLNGLFGRDLCRVNILPETDRVIWYKFGSPARDVEVTALLEERYRPIGFLRDFNLVDTPGTNSIIQGHQDITERFIPTADLVLFVFPVTNPWGAATWDFISRIPAETLERVAFVIQQADQREPVDIEVIRGHMADLSMKRIGRVPPIFAVSGKLAFEAKRTVPPAAGPLKASGFAAFEAFISRSVCQSPARRQVLQDWRGQAAAALRVVEDRIEDQTRHINSQSRFLQQVEHEIAGLRDSFVRRLVTHLVGVAQVFEAECRWIVERLGRRLRVTPSFGRVFFGDRTGHEIEDVFIARLQAAVEEIAEKDGNEVVEECHEHWQDLGARVVEEMGIELIAPEPIGDTLAAARERFMARIGRAARQGIGNLKVRHQLDKELRRRNLAIKAFLVSGLLLATAAGVCGALAVPWVPFILLAFATLFLGGGILTAWFTRRRIAHEFETRMLDTCGAFASTLHSDYEEALHIVFRDYLSALNQVRSHLAREKLAIEPRLKRWQELFLTLKAIEQEL